MHYNYPLSQQLQLFKDLYDYSDACKTIHNPYKSGFERLHALITVRKFWNKYLY